MYELTAILKSPEEILGIKGIKEFTTEQNQMYTLALYEHVGLRGILIDNINFVRYAYTFSVKGYTQPVTGTWLKDFQKKINWNRVPVDTKIEMTIVDTVYRGYFSHYDHSNSQVHIFSNGATSWSSTKPDYKDKTEFTHESSCVLVECD